MTTFYAHCPRRHTPSISSKLAVIVATATALLAAEPIQAQGFLKRLVDRTVQKVAEKAAQAAGDLGDRGANAVTEVAGSSAETVTGAAPQAESGMAGTLSRSATAAAPAPARGSYASDIAKPADFDSMYQAYTDFAKVSCDACEGGYEPAGWARFPSDELSVKANALALRVGALPIGHVHRWEVKGAVGTMKVAIEETVNGLRCRRLEYRVAKGNASAERPGLVCWGRRDQSSSMETWHEIY